jgi:flagellar biosynthesis chaperone FliJ
MKTKFLPIVNVKKQIVKRVENELTNINFKIKSIENEIIAIEDEIINTQMPQSGTFSIMVAAQETTAIYRSQIKLKKEDLKQVELQKMNINRKLKNANLEYEKVKHLHDVEIQERIKEMKKKEELEMNEVALMLFNNNKNS